MKSQDHKLFVARNGDQQIVGWVHVGKEMPSLLADDRADIGALVVDTKVRSQGIGRVRFRNENPLVEATRQRVCFVFAGDSTLKQVRASLPRESLNVFQYPEFAGFVRPITKPSVF